MEIDRLTVGYQHQPVLRECSCVLGIGLHLVVGSNGAGKTTLFRVIAGILAPWSGQVRLQLGGAAGAPPLDRVAYAPERPGLPGRLSVLEALAYLDRLRGGSPSDRAQRIAATLAATHLADLGDRRVEWLSRGQARRVALAGARMSRAPIIVCDEPTANLDLASAEAARAELARLAADRVVVVASHDPTEAEALTAHLESPLDLLALDGGQIAAQGSPQEVRERVVARARRIRLRSTEPILPAIAGLDLPFHAHPAPDPHEVLIEVASDPELAAIVRHLVLAGIDLVEVTPTRGDAAEVAAALSGELQ